MGHILVDSRAGSADQLNADGSLRSTGVARYIVPQGRVRVRKGMPVDIYFTGRGPRGAVIEVGIEYKTVWDVLDCIKTGRFAGNQLEPLRELDFGLMLIEGIFRRAGSDRGGRLEVYGTPRAGCERGWYDTSEWGRGRKIWEYSTFEHWYWSMMFRGGVYVLPFAADKYESGRVIGSLWQAFNDKAWEEHVSHLATNKAHLAPLRGSTPPFVRAIAEYTGVGPEVALAAERTFKHMHAASNAPLERWAKMLVGGGYGKRGVRKRALPLGKKRAQIIFDELRGKR